MLRRGRGQLAVTPIPAGPDEVSAWAGLCCNTPVSEGFSHRWHSLSRAKTSGEKKEGKYSPVTKALPLSRSNTDCRAGMNHEASAAVSADLNCNTFSSPRVSGVEECRIALLSRAELLLANHSGGEVKRCSPLGVIEIKSPSYCVGGNKCSLLQGAAAF